MNSQSVNTQPAVGFIGLGIMGKPMAKNLIKAGYHLNVYNRTASKADELVALGAVPHASPAALASKSDVIIVMVSDSGDVEQVVLGPSGVIEGVQRGAVVIITSTISPSTVRNVAAKLAQKDVEVLDAPVSGGEEGAKNATLSIMVGGKRGIFDRCLPILRAVGTNVVHMGEVGMGEMAKLCNQIMASLNLLAMCEGLTLAAKAGLDLEKLLEALQGGAARSWALVNQAPKVLKGDFRPGFTIKLQQKDLRLALGAAEELHVPLLGCSLVHELYKAVEAEPGGELFGNHALIRAIEKLAGCEVRVP
ncbi:MAG TPA: NAD-binding protein [Firmicutes bacterium]|nr:NAD-binding protein [Bacillota bacterium]